MPRSDREIDGTDATAVEFDSLVKQHVSHPQGTDTQPLIFSVMFGISFVYLFVCKHGRNSAMPT